MNACSVVMMGLDKLSAKADSQRIPEMWFFLFSLAGGFVGVMLGIITFRHKTRKIGFQLKILSAAALSTLILLSMLVQK
ncbi:MAG: DUF1294 domain-containing protein [Candidatus Bathyarchaeia archaeon]